jgi:hypothetical protein
MNGRDIFNNCFRRNCGGVDAATIASTYKANSPSGGFWYVPTLGEFGYYSAKLGLIRNKII